MEQNYVIETHNLAKQITCFNGFTFKQNYSFIFLSSSEYSDYLQESTWPQNEIFGTECCCDKFCIVYKLTIISNQE